jgi:hypothetical protein
MRTSVHLPSKLESQVADYCNRHGVSKSDIVLRSIQEFLLRHAQPSSLEIYNEVMRDDPDPERDGKREAAEQRPHKLEIRSAFRRKLATESTQLHEPK